MTFVVAFSGSPIKGGAIKKGLSMVLEGTGGARAELIRLSPMNLNISVGRE
ncbi:MAG: hypothetical protein LBO66_03170 [Deltaproteobacteria bacterium]|nr:hypothetical protein [Deltaproteobacteria bacterium]